MTRRNLSTIWTFPCKFVLPVLHALATDVLAGVMYVDGLWPAGQAKLLAIAPHRGMQAVLWAAWVLGLGYAVWFGWQIKRVERDGENLFISNYRQEVCVPVAAIVDVRQNIWFGSRLVWVRLEEELPPELVPWGRWIGFMPTARFAFGFERYRRHPVVAELLDESAAARRARGMARMAAATTLGRRGGFGYTPRL